MNTQSRVYTIMDVFDFRDIWQPILAFATNGAFLLGVRQPPKMPILTHTLTNLRATCRAARAMIPAPTKLTPAQLCAEGAKRRNLALCNLAEEHGNKDYAPALRAAAENGCDVIVDLILCKMTDNRSQLDALYLAAANHHIDICKKIIAHHGSDNVSYYMSAGAAAGGYMDLIEWTKQLYGLDYFAMFINAFEVNHIEICDMALKSARVDIDDVAQNMGCRTIVHCTLFRNYVKERKLISADFYQNLMLGAAEGYHHDILQVICIWAKEDGYQINYTELISDIIYLRSIDDNRIQSKDRRACEIIREFSQQDDYQIDYNVLINSLGEDVKYAINLIQRWAKQDNYEITERIDDVISAEDPHDDEQEPQPNHPRPTDEELATTCAIYNKVQTWDDLIHTNIEFLRGNMRATFYYSGPFRDWCYDDGMNRLERDLIHLHEEYKIFTHDGQDNQLGERPQRGYLNFACLPALGLKLVPMLLEDARIYTFAQRFAGSRDEIVYKNISDKVELTPPNTYFRAENYNNVLSEIELSAREYPDIQRLLRDCYHVFITFREFPQTADAPEITTILLDNLQKIERGITPV